MKAIVVNKWVKSIDELKVFPDVPEPTLKENQILIEIKAIALNFFDILQVNILVFRKILKIKN